MTLGHVIINTGKGTTGAMQGTVVTVGGKGFFSVVKITPGELHYLKGKQTGKSQETHRASRLPGTPLGVRWRPRDQVCGG